MIRIIVYQYDMISDEVHDIEDQSRPTRTASMTRALSMLLIVGQWVLAIGFVLMLVMALIMAVPNEFRDTLLADSPTAPTASVFLGQCLAGAIIAVGWFFVLKLLRKVVIAVMHGDPFLTENVAHLRNIWVIMAITEIFRMIAHIVIDTSFGSEGSTLAITVRTWFFIFVIAAISEAFRHGAALRAEQELTI